MGEEKPPRRPSLRMRLLTAVLTVGGVVGIENKVGTEKPNLEQEPGAFPAMIEAPPLISEEIEHRAFPIEEADLDPALSQPIQPALETVKKVHPLIHPTDDQDKPRSR